ncbi:MAG: hypothetical protein QOH21_573 [Acidobacteriota bacterium]|jgi:signal transduction histidine kinase|nr:hypothetical protein [Acidobacteriota bacterium]
MSSSIATGVSGSPKVSAAPRVSISCAAVMAGAALLVLFGWWAEVDVLRNGFLGSVAVRPFTAMVLILAAFTLVQRGPWGSAASAVIFAVGLATCAEYAFGVDLWIGNAGFFRVPEKLGQAYPMRMSPQAALTAVLAGVAGVVHDYSRGRPTAEVRLRFQRIAQMTATATAWICLVAIVATAYDGHIFLALGPLTPLALPTALLYLIWCIGFFARMTDEGTASLLVTGDRWGATVRRMTIVAIAAPFLFGLLCLALVRDRWIDMHFAMALAITGTTLTLIFAIVTYTGQLREEDARRDAAHRTLKQAYDVLRERVAALQDVGQESTGGLKRVHENAGRDETRIEELAAHLASAHRELEAFSYSVSHDLRAPLRAIAGFSRELLRAHTANLDERGRHYLERIQAGADRTLQLIDDLLRLSQAGRATMRRTPVDVTALAASVTAELRETAPSPVTVDVAAGLAADADERLLRIVYGNLIGNAVKFSARGPSPRVEIGATEAGTFFVRDNGVGFDHALAQNVFRAFERLQSDFEGTGIGLAIVHRIIHRHGGTIWAQSSPDAGATFFFTLGPPKEPAP